MFSTCIYIKSFKLMMHSRTKYTYCLCYLKVIIIFSISFSKSSVVEDIILLAMLVFSSFFFFVLFGIFFPSLKIGHEEYAKLKAKYESLKDS